MIKTKLFSQRDSKWKNNKHGTSTSTIGNTGCTITELCVILNHAGYNETPKTVDDKLTANSGYAQGNLLNWLVVPKIWPNLKFIYRYKQYGNEEDSKAKEWIKRGMIPIIEVKANPIGGAPGGKHWVGALGDSKVHDPWALPGASDEISTFDKWEETGMALYEYKPVLNTVETPQDNMSKELEVCLTDRKKFWEERDALQAKLDKIAKGEDSNYISTKDSEKKITEATKDLKDTIKQKEKDLDSLTDELTEANKKASWFDEVVEKLKITKTDGVVSADTVFRSVTAQISSKDTKIADLESKLEEALKPKGVLVGKRKLIAGVVTALIVAVSKVLAERFGIDISAEELFAIILPALAYIGVEGVKDIKLAANGEDTNK